MGKRPNVLLRDVKSARSSSVGRSKRWNGEIGRGKEKDEKSERGKDANKL